MTGTTRKTTLTATLFIGAFASAAAVANTDSLTRTLAMVDALSETCARADLLHEETQQHIQREVTYLRKLYRVAQKPYESQVETFTGEFTAHAEDCEQLAGLVPTLEREVELAEQQFPKRQDGYDWDGYATLPERPRDYDTLRVLGAFDPDPVGGVR